MDSREEGKLTFAVIGDFGGHPQPPYTTWTQRKLARVMAVEVGKNFGTRFIVGLGDNFYFNGVKKVEDPRFHQTFENVYSDPVLKTSKWYMIAGNHDHHGNVSAQIAYSKVSPRWHFPDFFYTKEEKIPGTSATIQLVMIDTTLLCGFKKGPHFPTQESQMRWIKDTLESSKADYLLVCGHHPVLSVGMHGNTHCLLDKLKPLMEEHDVTAYFSGHDHNLQHIKAKDSDVHYFVTGNGNFYNPSTWNRHTVPHKALKYFYGHSGAFTLLEATPSELKVKMMDDNAKEMHMVKLLPRSRVDVDPQVNHSVLDDFFSLQTAYDNAPASDDYE